MHTLREPHLTALNRILRYLRGSLDYDLLLRPSPMSELIVYTDVDWVGCPDTRRSTSGYVVFLGANLVSWTAKRQPVVSRSSAEAEYRVVANGMAEASWLRQLLQELHNPLQHATLVYCDNVSAVYLSTNPVQHQRTKQVEIDLHLVRERVAAGDIRVLSIPTTLQFADIFTKGSRRVYSSISNQSQHLYRIELRLRGVYPSRVALVITVTPLCNGPSPTSIDIYQSQP
jgi:hypothetical protein